MICVGAHDEQGRPDERPAIPESYVIDWANVATVEQAQREHEVYVIRERERNQAIGAYIVKIEGRLFVCSSNNQWWLDYWAGLPGSE